MKPVKNLIIATLLVSSIVFNTFAGEVQVPGAPAPPPDPPRMTTTEETPTDPSTDTQQTTVDTSDYLFYEMLAALLSVY
jgi:hypothetical protein